MRLDKCMSRLDWIQSNLVFKVGLNPVQPGQDSVQPGFPSTCNTHHHYLPTPTTTTRLHPPPSPANTHHHLSTSTTTCQHPPPSTDTHRYSTHPGGGCRRVRLVLAGVSGQWCVVVGVSGSWWMLLGGGCWRVVVGVGSWWWWWVLQVLHPGWTESCPDWTGFSPTLNTRLD